MTDVRLRHDPRDPERRARIEVNGHDLADVCEGVTLDWRHDRFGLRLRISEHLTTDITSADADAEVTIPEPVHDALIALGWTPPKEHP